jgi:hypothetical protein
VSQKAACNTCAQDNCCTEANTCIADQAAGGCVELNNCLVDCFNGVSPNDAGTFDAADIDGAVYTCETQCVGAASSSGKSELKALDTCIQTNCNTAATCGQ